MSPGHQVPRQGLSDESGIGGGAIDESLLESCQLSGGAKTICSIAREGKVRPGSGHCGLNLGRQPCRRKCSVEVEHRVAISKFFRYIPLPGTKSVQGVVLDRRKDQLGMVFLESSNDISLYLRRVNNWVDERYHQRVLTRVSRGPVMLNSDIV
jgi:hypothetical protein